MKLYINMYIYLYPKSASVILLLPKNKYTKPFYGLIMISLCLSWLRGGVLIQPCLTNVTKCPSNISLRLLKNADDFRFGQMIISRVNMKKEAQYMAGQINRLQKSLSLCDIEPLDLGGLGVIAQCQHCYVMGDIILQLLVLAWNLAQCERQSYSKINMVVDRLSHSGWGCLSFRLFFRSLLLNNSMKMH